MMSLARFVFSVCAAVVLTLAAASNVSAAPPDDRIVVIISLDGLAGYYLDDPKAEMPAIRQLAAEGARAASMKACVPTVTWPTHTTLVTGVHPAKHGVIGNNFLDRQTGKRVALLGDPVFDKDQIVKCPTIYDAAKAAGLKTAGVRWPATRNAKALDLVISDVGSIELLKRTTTASLVQEATDAGLWADVDAAEKKEGPDGRWLPSDAMVTKVFNLILTKHRPNVALLHLIDIDHDEHLFGPRSPEAYQRIKEADAHVREVWDTLKAQFPGKATLVVVSDHGFSAIRRQILPNVVLRKAKLLNDVAEENDPKPLIRVVPQGGSAMIYILDASRRSEVVAKVKQAFDGMEGVQKVVGPDELPALGVARPADDPRAPDIMLFAEMGYAFGDTVAGDMPFNEKPERKGTHGHDPNLPELRATFVAWGAGIRKGVNVGDIESVSVTPTIAKLLGLEMAGLDGKPLDAALSGSN